MSLLSSLLARSLMGPTASGLRVVDLFAGGGGASQGIREALGVSPVLAVNHDPAAIAMHARNHPDTLHLCESVYDVHPREAVRGLPIDLLWASPDCTHFSRAKGGKPLDGRIRGLAWIVVEWARACRPRVIAMENVPEFVTWGPLHPADHPDRALRNRPIRDRVGETFDAFVQALRAEGYVVEWRTLRACDHGAPTSRKRWFLVARLDGQPIRWPAPTHVSRAQRAKGDSRPTWRDAGSCIDFDLPCPSIFLSAEEGRRLNVRRPLAPATLRRIAEGIKRFVVESPQPYLLKLTHGGRLERLDEPMSTVTGAHRGETALVVPTIAPVKSWGGGGNHAGDAGEPLRTITGSKRGEFALVATTLINTRNGERLGQRPRALDPREPLTTVTAAGSQGAVVQATLAAAFLAQHNGTTPDKLVVGRDCREPMQTTVGRVNRGPVVAYLAKLYGTSHAAGLDEPCPTVTGQGGHLALVTAFLDAYAGIGPYVEIGGDMYVIVDIGMRMLTPRELARAQGFEDTYILDGSKTAQTKRIGNSVPPPMVRALVAANFQPAPVNLDDAIAAK